MLRRLLVAAALLLAVVSVHAQGRRGPDWVLLGERSVTDRADHDIVPVTAKRGEFRAIRLDVMLHAVDFHRVVVHFGNGDDQKVELRATIPAGGSSRAIDLEGADRVIKSIEFWYDANTIGRGGKAVVRTMGRR